MLIRTEIGFLGLLTSLANQDSKDISIIVKLANSKLKYYDFTQVFMNYMKILNNYDFSPSWDKQEWVPDSCCDVSKVHNDSVSTMHNCGKMRKPELWYQEVILNMLKLCD